MILFLGHAALMAAGWAIAVSAILVAATQRKRRWWFRVHRGLGLSAAVLILAGGAMAVAAVALSTGEHFRSPHTWLGALTVAMAVAAPLLGFLQFKIRGRAERLRASHLLGGRFLAGAGLVAILLGLRLAGYL